MTYYLFKCGCKLKFSKNFLKHNKKYYLCPEHKTRLECKVHICKKCGKEFKNYKLKGKRLYCFECKKEIKNKTKKKCSNPNCNRYVAPGNRMLCDICDKKSYTLPELYG